MGELLMSDLGAVFIISFIVATGVALNIYIASLTVNLAGQIVTGVMHGNPIPKATRRSLVFQAWVPWQILGVASAALLGLAAFSVADLVDQPSIKLLARLSAFIAAVGSLWYLINAMYGARKYLGYLQRID